VTRDSLASEAPSKRLLSCLAIFSRLRVLSCLTHTLAGRTSPARERGSAAGSLLSSHRPKWCRPSLELPFYFVWFLGWSTQHLALDPSSVLYLQHKLCSYLDALQHLPPPQPVPRQLLPLRAGTHPAHSATDSGSRPDSKILSPVTSISFWEGLYYRPLSCRSYRDAPLSLPEYFSPRYFFSGRFAIKSGL
jgi:hypothetical protein